MSYARVVINTDLDATQLAGELRLSDAGAVDGRQNIQNLATWLEGNGGFGRGINLRFVKNAVRAALVGTFTDAPSNADTIVINGVTFTAVTSGAVANQFNISTSGSAGAKAIANAALFAAAINASVSAKIKNIIKASVDGLGGITLTCLVPGSIGNLCTVTDSFANFTWAGAATVLSGGTEDTEVVLDGGYSE